MNEHTLKIMTFVKVIYKCIGYTYDMYMIYKCNVYKCICK